MMQIHYFASIREQMDREQDQIALPSEVKNVAELIQYLRDQNSRFDALFSSNRKLLVAVNQTVVNQNYQLSESDEVAFFPPMTGG